MTTFILNASDQSTYVPDVEPADSLKSILKCAFLSRAQIVSTYVSQTENIQIETALAFI